MVCLNIWLTKKNLDQKHFLPKTCLTKNICWRSRFISTKKVFDQEQIEFWN